MPLERITEMKRNPVLLLVIMMALFAALPAGAGITDAVKKKAAKTLKGDKPTPATTEAGPIQSRMSPEVTAERLAQFQKGLELEVAEREKAGKFLASLKTQEAWDECKQKLMMTEEAQKIYLAVGDLPENATADDLQKVSAKVNAQMEALTLKHCGPDPSKFDAGRMTREAIGKGSDLAGLGDDLAYAAWKEWVLEFCNYLEKLKEQPDAEKQIAKIKGEGLRIPGDGRGVYWVFSASEAALLIERCDHLKPLIEATL